MCVIFQECRVQIEPGYLASALVERFGLSPHLRRAFDQGNQTQRVGQRKNIIELLAIERFGLARAVFASGTRPA